MLEVSEIYDDGDLRLLVTQQVYKQGFLWHWKVDTSPECTHSLGRLEMHWMEDSAELPMEGKALTRERALKAAEEMKLSHLAINGF